VIELEQYKIVEAVSEKIIADRICDAIYLKGEIARQEHDEYSDIDLFVLVPEKNFDAFLDKRIEYLEAYQSILYHNFVFHIHPEVICIYENGYRLNLYTVKDRSFTQYGDIIVIYDPKKILAEYKKIPYAFSPQEIGELLNLFSLLANEYYVVCKRNDIIYSLRLANYLFEEFASLFRLRFDAENAKLGLKNLLNKADWESRKIVKEIVALLNQEHHLEAVKMMFIALDGLIGTFPLKIVEHVNFDFYNFSKKLIMSMN
jgi:predicted nucleotidyltransferase